MLAEPPIARPCHDSVFVRGKQNSRIPASGVSDHVGLKSIHWIDFRAASIPSAIPLAPACARRPACVRRRAAPKQCTAR